jgi:hypothetical protein
MGDVIKANAIKANAINTKVIKESYKRAQPDKPVNPKSQILL